VEKIILLVNVGRSLVTHQNLTKIAKQSFWFMYAFHLNPIFEKEQQRFGARLCIARKSQAPIALHSLALVRKNSVSFANARSCSGKLARKTKGKRCSRAPWLRLTASLSCRSRGTTDGLQGGGTPQELQHNNKICYCLSGIKNGKNI